MRCTGRCLPEKSLALTGDPSLVYHAVCYDPLTAAVLSLAEIKQMTQEMLKRYRRHLPQFKSVRI